MSILWNGKRYKDFEELEKAVKKHNEEFSKLFGIPAPDKDSEVAVANEETPEATEEAKETKGAVVEEVAEAADETVDESDQESDDKAHQIDEIKRMRKSELYEFADQNGITIPDDLRRVGDIREFLINYLEREVE